MNLKPFMFRFLIMGIIVTIAGVGLLITYAIHLQGQGNTVSPITESESAFAACPKDGDVNITGLLEPIRKKYQVPAMIIFVDVPRIMGQTLMDKAHGGPYDNPFQHACEAETSLSMALFPEMVQLENAEDNTPWGFLPPGHLDRGGDIYGNPIPGHCAVGCGGIECVIYPEGVIGKPSLADPKKAYKSVEVTLDYIKKLHDDIMGKFPPGVLPESKYLSQRPAEEIEALLKGPLKGGRHLYTVAFPP